MSLLQVSILQILQTLLHLWHTLPRIIPPFNRPMMPLTQARQLYRGRPLSITVRPVLLNPSYSLGLIVL